jgi:hypothetical protein
VSRAAVVLALAAAAACSPEHTVTLDLGVTGDPDRLPAGFACVRDDTGELMMADALTGDELALTLVVDFLDMDGGVPLCRGDAIARWCEDHGGCLPIEIPGGVRYCTELRVTVDVGDPVASANAFNAALSGAVVIEDAPDVPVMVRVVGTLQSCGEVERWSGAGYPVFDPARVVGCEYSCPVFLDEVDELVLSLDTFDQNCEQLVLQCAAGP